MLSRFNIFLFSFFTPLLSLYSFLFSLISSLSVTLYLFPLSPPCSWSLATNLHSPRCWLPQPSPLTFRSLNPVVGVRFGMGFDMWVLGHWLIGWVEILGFWWCRGCGGGWLSFGPTMFMAIVGGGVCWRFWVFSSFSFLFRWDFWISNLLEIQWLWL